MEATTSWLGPGMFIVALASLLLGYPVAFTLGGVAVLFAGVGIVTGTFDGLFLTALPQRVFGIMGNFTLLAIPAFVFMGAMLERSGLAEQLLESMARLLGRIRGGLALAVVLVGALMAATTGVVAATVITMGLISLPTMLRHGYDKSLATGVISASGTLGQIIPPSIVLVVLADQLGISVGDLFIGSVIPGLLMVASFGLYVLIIAHLKPNLAPPLSPSENSHSLWKDLRQTMPLVWPPLVLILLVLGSIFFGIATPTEAGAMGAVGTMVMAAWNGRLTLRTIREVSDNTLSTTSMVMFILLGSTAFSLVFRGFDGDQLIADLLLRLPGEAMGFLSLNMITIFILGFFIDFFEIAFIVVPLFAPVAQTIFGPEALVWYGVIIGANLQSSFLTPPFGFALFYLRSVAPPQVTTGHIYRGAIPFILLQMLVLIIIILCPQLVTALPQLVA
ncbi:MAG: C4-dicarboxylate ABC transporter [Candidatus Synechococcus spongiarum 142]|uniref:C4-dicarboxylate ABC transporter n=1 Tax=Candidatus Synechococcus spongiarum 142 TaxID=1608213 RepID=A0A6N3X2H0_9SYNE|nr:MAG: C4-dicarboxylate ABC transporter [Candidatus Synechococcus spongiarum 142]